MIRAVLDVNVLASGSLKTPTPPGLLLDIWQADSFRLIVSEHILVNLQRALAKPYFQRRLTAAEINAFLALLRQEATLVPPHHRTGAWRRAGCRRRFDAGDRP